MVVAAMPIADAGNIAAWCWHGSSILMTVGLLLVYVLRQEAGWFFVAVGLFRLSSPGWQVA
jgi:hypothetical protein